MASLLIHPAPHLLHHPRCCAIHLPRAALRTRHVRCTTGARRRRGVTVVARGAPSASSYVFAIMLPVTLLVATVFTSMRITDRLDEKFLEELEVNEAIRQAYKEDDDEDDDDDDSNDGDEDIEEDVEGALLEEIERMKEKALSRPRTRDRPKREA